MSIVMAFCRAGALVAILFSPTVAADGALLAADGQVHELFDDDFAKAIQEHPMVFVMFYAPWCGHCKALAPKWATVAESTTHLGVPMAKVDSEAEKPLAEALGVISFPKLMLFRGDVDAMVEFTGEHEAADIEAWLKAHAPGGTESVVMAQPGSTAAEIQAWVRSERPPKLPGSGKLTVLGLLAGGAHAQDAALVKMMETAAFTLNPDKMGADVPVGTAQLAPTELEQLGLTMRGRMSDPWLPCVLLFRDFRFEDEMLVYQDVSDVKPFLSWLQSNRLPALLPARQDTEAIFLGDSVPGNALVMLLGADEFVSKDLSKIAEQLKEKNETRLRFAHAEVKPNYKHFITVGKTVGVNVRKELPEMVLWEFGEEQGKDKYFRLSRYNKGSFPEEDFASKAEELIEMWRADKLTQSSRAEL